MTLYKYDSVSLTYKVAKRSWLKPVVYIGLITFITGFTAAVRTNAIIEKIPVIIRVNEEEFSPENLKREIQRLNFKYPDIIFKQASLETGQFTSTRFQLHNNLFGMKISYSRPSTAVSEETDHATYHTWKESLLDRALWDAQNLKGIKTQSEYLQLLGAFYAEDPMYIVKLNSISL